MPVPLTLRKSRALLATGLPPAFVLALAGLAKAIDPFPAGLFLHSTLTVPIAAAIVFARALGIVEILLAYSIIALQGRSRVPALAGVGLFSLFVGLLIRLMITHPEAATCGCFGDLLNGLGPVPLRVQCGLDFFLGCLLIAHCLIHGPKEPAGKPGNSSPHGPEP